MKKYLLIGLVLIVFIGCEQDDDIIKDAEEKEETQYKNEALKNNITYDVKDVAKLYTYYTVKDNEVSFINEAQLKEVTMYDSDMNLIGTYTRVNNDIKIISNISSKKYFLVKGIGTGLKFTFKN